MRVAKRHIYGIIGHQLPDGEGAPDGIELYTEELVDIQLDLQEIEQHISDLTVGRFGNIEGGDHGLTARLRSGLQQPKELQDLEAECQSILERIAGARQALVTGHISEAGIDPDDYSERARRDLHNWVDDGTFPEYLQELERGADRVGHRLASKRETVNARTNLLVGLTTVVVSCLLVVFGAMRLVATILT